MSRKAAVAVNTLIYHGYDFATAVTEISQLGVEYVEPVLIASYYEQIDDDYFTSDNARKLKTLIENNGLKTVAMGTHLDLGVEGAVDSFRRRMELPGELGAGIVHTNTTTAVMESVFLENLEKLIPLAESLDLVIALENPGDGEDHEIKLSSDSTPVAFSEIRRILERSLSYIGNNLVPALREI